VIRRASAPLRAPRSAPADPSPAAPSRPAARAALEAAGFRWIDEETGSITVTDLCVYYFGGRDPLDIGTLLFYWQD
jgi:hypothetical protein